MLKQWLVGTAMAAALALGAPAAIVAQNQQPQTTATTTDAKQDMKNAGKKTKAAGKDAGDAAKAAGKSAAKATKHTAKRVKHDVKHAVGKTTATCKDGTVRTGRTKTTACTGHGGVADRQ